MLCRLLLAAILAGFSTHAEAQHAQGQRMMLVDERGLPISTTNPLGSSGTLRSAGTNRSATVGTTAANLWPVNVNRQGAWIKNDSTADIWCNYDGTAAATPGGGNFRIAANGGFYDTEANFVSTNALSCISTASVAITSREH